MEQPAAIEIDGLTVRFDTRNIPEGFSMRIEAGGKGDGKMSRTTGIFITVSIAVFLTSPTLADWKENARAIDISGGEDHPLVLTQNKWPWACGPNYAYQLGIGDNTDPRKTLVRVLKGDTNSTSDYLEHMNDVAAGWKHSLVLDVSDSVWVWG